MTNVHLRRQTSVGRTRAGNMPVGQGSTCFRDGHGSGAGHTEIWLISLGALLTSSFRP